jgi:hypothetical protein
MKVRGAQNVSQIRGLVAENFTTPVTGETRGTSLVRHNAKDSPPAAPSSYLSLSSAVLTIHTELIEELTGAP